MAVTTRPNGIALVRWIGIAIGLPVLLAVMLLGKDAVLVVQGIDQNSLERERAAFDNGIKRLGELHASELLSQTLWDEAFRKVVLQHDPGWVKRNFGKDQLSEEGSQIRVIVDPKGKILFAVSSSGTLSADDENLLLSLTQRAAGRARKLYGSAQASGEGFDERMPGAMLDGIYVTDLISWHGEAAIVTASPFAPDSDDQLAPREPTLLIGLQVLTPAVFDKLEAMSQIEDIEQSSAHPPVGSVEHLYPLRDADGNVVAHVTWDASNPAYDVLLAALPAVILSLGVISVLTVAGGVWMQRLTRRLAESEAAATYSSRHDAATGLANRGWFMLTFEDLVRSRTGGATHAVALIDCDKFKFINDTLGHAAGDAVLAAIAARLKSFEPRLLIAGRLGGDEFAVISAPLENASDAGAFADNVARALMLPVVFGTHVIPVGVSVGASAFEVATDRPIDAMLLEADLALYRAKRDGRGCARVYDPVLDEAPPAITSAHAA